MAFFLSDRPYGPYRLTDFIGFTDFTTLRLYRLYGLYGLYRLSITLHQLQQKFYQLPLVHRF